MTKKKSTTNWYFLLAGVIVLSFNISRNQTHKQPELKTISVELLKDIINVKGNRPKMDYKFWTKEYKNQFNILKGSITSGKHKEISKLNAGQIVDLYISTTDYENLRNESEDILVHGISIKGETLMSTHEFSKNRDMYETRVMIFLAFFGIMLLLNGLILVSNKINYTIIGCSLGIILFMRIFEIGLY